VPTTRLEAFSDGVFAIAITLLVLQIRLPEHGRGTLSHQLLHQWPSYIAYLISFVTIGIIWVNHHNVFGHIGRVDRPLMFINIFFLMFVALIPFPTFVVADFLHETAAAVLYGTALTITAVFFNILWQYVIRKPGILRVDADPREVDGITRSFWPGAFIYASATAVALASPVASIALFGALALFYMLPSARFARLPG
jgi:uncharacterized membrane protein